MQLVSLSILVSILATRVRSKETVKDAALIARRLIGLPPGVGVMATIFPKNSALEGEPFALQEYYATCYSNGSLSLITMPISRHTRNIIHSPMHSASLTVGSSPPAASKPRVSLIGNVTILETQLAIDSGIQDCYLEQHPDAKFWLPDDPDGAHEAYWARFDPHSIFFVGGFGNKHYIGDVPLDVYRSVYPGESRDDYDAQTDAFVMQGENW